MSSMRPSEGGGDGREEVAAGVGAEGVRESGKDEGTPPPVLQAPAHLIARVFSQLDCVDLLNCSLVCKQWYRESAELREGWKNEYLEARHLYGMSVKRESHPPSSTCSIRGLGRTPSEDSSSPSRSRKRSIFLTDILMTQPKKGKGEGIKMEQGLHVSQKFLLYQLY
ncbi:uncharacterized protein LOC103695921 isoform X1 [Phoenix dactylifera]|uniref:Uncharacterized protein LOC103695921 isoform X1 n=1 Tax=Phoenix dactylifera TaxID=42345 RepID=A0A8B7BFJ9_PHODC|nr:uncharacterized protein LOC103695921 isoform X1 [Phoenix dactylifera]